jgi:hypothetical protein
MLGLIDVLGRRMAPRLLRVGSLSSCDVQGDDLGSGGLRNLGRGSRSAVGTWGAIVRQQNAPYNPGPITALGGQEHDPLGGDSEHRFGNCTKVVRTSFDTGVRAHYKQWGRQLLSRTHNRFGRVAGTRVEHSALHLLRSKTEMGERLFCTPLFLAYSDHV